MWQCLYPQDCILIWICRPQINYITLQYIHRTLIRCRNIFVFVLCMILDSSNTVQISFPAGQKASNVVWQCAGTNYSKICCGLIIVTFICLENREWPSVWCAEVLDTLQHTVLFSVTPIRCDFLFAVQGSMTLAVPTSGRITVMLCSVFTLVSL